jgi:fructose-bisphosphate aldolase, class I
MSNEQQVTRIRNSQGLIAALDQSGGSTPQALSQYGILPETYTGPEEMFNRAHEMRTRIMTAESFSSKSILGAILFANTLDREVQGMPTAEYLWEKKGIVPFLKIDQGLGASANGVQLMKPITSLDQILASAKNGGVFGTKQRSVISSSNAEGISSIVAQQIELAKRVLDFGLVPIIEPEILIDIPDKSNAEKILLEELLSGFEEIPDDGDIMVKLSLPTIANLYLPIVNHRKVLRVLALSGGHSQEKANEALAKNNGMIASFSRGLSVGLCSDQTETDFNQVLSLSIGKIFSASIA